MDESAGAARPRRSVLASGSVPQFRATVAELGSNLCLVSVSGELDLYVEDELLEVLDEAEALGVQTVVVDLSGVSFLDSTACGILVSRAKRLRKSDRELVLTSNDLRTVGVLELVGITRIVRHFETLHGALQELLVEAV
jgi:anti-anti-sigma factor